MNTRPNVVFVFSDQHRFQATGFAGDPNVKTPHLDHLAEESIRFGTSISCIPVCSPNRATLLTGQYPLTHGLFINDIPIGSKPISIAQAFAGAGYNTAYIGKWHIDGQGRESFIPMERRMGFEFWRVLECTHDYLHSRYYDDTDKTRFWDGYDAEAQTRCAQAYIREHGNRENPFFLTLAWGPPHDPYHTAPDEFRAMYDPKTLVLPPNIPQEESLRARQALAGYYAHITALDACIGELLTTLKEEGLEEDTVFVYTSDHGDMLGSQGLWNKQYPFDESIHVPFLLRYPREFGRIGRLFDTPFNSPDVMPTLLGLCGVDIPETVEGTDYSDWLWEMESPDIEGVLIEIIYPFGQWPRVKGGKEYRGVRTTRYTYVADLNGPWLLFDNIHDPYQLDNLIRKPGHAELEQELGGLLERLLKQRGDDFLPGEAYTKHWGYKTDPDTGKVIAFESPL